MKRLRNRHGETLIESLISMLIIALTTAMLTMTVATVMRSYQEAGQTLTFTNENLSASSPTVDVEEIEDVGVTLKPDFGAESEIGYVKLKRQRGKFDTDGWVYYYEKDSWSATATAGSGDGPELP